MTPKKFYTIIWILILVFIIIDFIWNQINLANLQNLEKIVVKVEKDEKLYIYSFKENSYSELGEEKYNKILLNNYYLSKDWNYFITVQWLNYKPSHYTLWITNTKTWRVYIVNTKEDKFHHIEKIVWYIE